jgi:alkylation response protein AidB-like acyl-CoA dehydrogenase
MSVYLPEDAAREIYDPPGAVVAGQIAPNGKAVAVEGGFRVSGRWSFGSGIHHATWVASGCLLSEEDAEKTGLPARIHVMTPASDVVVDEASWNVSGLRGTGSCDYALHDVFVPRERAFAFFVSTPFDSGPLSLLPRTMFAIAISAVTLGIARNAVDAMVRLASETRVAGTLLRERVEVQLAAAKAEALAGAARAYVRQTSDDVWQACLRGEEPTVEQRLRLRAASVAAPRMCAEAVDLVWKAAGAASIRESYVIERCFRDVHAATQHLGVSEMIEIDTGRGLLGVEPQVLPY